MSFGSGLASGLTVGMAFGGRIKDSMDKRGLAETMKEATTEEKTTTTEVNAPDAENYTLDSESGQYLPSLSAVQRGVSDTLSPVDPQYEKKTERVDKSFASPSERRMAQLQTGIDFWNSKGETDKALDLQDKLEQSNLRKLQVSGAERSERTAQTEEADKLEYKSLAETFSGAKIYKENAAAMADYEKQNAAYQDALKTNPDAAGSAPQKPALRAVTAVDQLKDASIHMQFNISKGKVSPVEALQFQQMSEKVKKEVGADSFKLLHSGDIQGAIKAFEQQGDVKIPEGAQVEARKGYYEVAGQKIPTHELVVRLPNGRTQVYNGLQGMDALDSADKVISNNFKGAELGIQGAGLALRQGEASRAEEKFNIEKPALQAHADDSKAQSVARKGLTEAIESGDPKKIDMAKQKAVAAGVKFDKPTMEYTTVVDQMGNRAIITNKEQGSARVVDLSSGATKDISGAGKPANPSFRSEAEAEKAKKNGTVKSGDMVTIGGRSARIN